MTHGFTSLFMAVPHIAGRSGLGAVGLGAVGPGAGEFEIVNRKELIERV